MRNRNSHFNQTVRARINQSSGWVKGEIIEKLPYRSYTIETENGATYRRNQKHIRASDEPQIVRSDSQPEVAVEPAQTQQTEPVATNPDQPIQPPYRQKLAAVGGFQQPRRMNEFCTR